MIVTLRVPSYRAARLLPERLAARRVVFYKLDTDERNENSDAARGAVGR